MGTISSGYPSKRRFVVNIWTKKDYRVCRRHGRLFASPNLGGQSGDPTHRTPLRCGWRRVRRRGKRRQRRRWTPTAAPPLSFILLLQSLLPPTPTRRVLRTIYENVIFTDSSKCTIITTKKLGEKWIEMQISTKIMELASRFGGKMIKLRKSYP